MSAAFSMRRSMCFQFILNQEELDKLELRVQTTKNRVAKREAEQYLKALRRALEKSEGFDILFRKNMNYRCGKYIVFCANYEHMQNIISAKIHDWCFILSMKM